MGMRREMRRDGGRGGGQHAGNALRSGHTRVGFRAAAKYLAKGGADSLTPCDAHGFFDSLLSLLTPESPLVVPAAAGPGDTSRAPSHAGPGGQFRPSLPL